MSHQSGLRECILEMIRRIESEPDDTEFGDITGLVEAAAYGANALGLPVPPVEYFSYERPPTSREAILKEHSGLLATILREPKPRKVPSWPITPSEHPEIFTAIGYRLYDPFDCTSMVVLNAAVADLNLDDPEDRTFHEPWAGFSKAAARTAAVTWLRRWVVYLSQPITVPDKSTSHDVPNEVPTPATSTSDDVDAGSDDRVSRGDELSLDLRAVGVFMEHPEWTKTKIAKALGRTRAALQPRLCPMFNRVWNQAHAKDSGKGRKAIRNDRTGDLEVIDDHESSEPQA